MRVFIAIVVILVALLLIGWMTISFSDSEARVRINTEKIEEDTQSMIEGGKRIVDGVDESVDVETDADPDADAEPADVDVDVEVEPEPAGTP